jgi:hypothetical protein
MASPISSASRSRIVLFSSVVFAIIVLAVVTALWAQRRARNRALADAGFEPRKIIQAAEEGKISEADRDAAIAQSIRAKLNEQLDGYFALPEGKPRKDYLDKIIDDQEQIRKTMGPIEARAAEPTTNPSGTSIVSKTTTTPDGKGQAQQIIIRKKGDASQLPPELRARVAEFAAALAQRRAERGLPPGQGTGVMIVKQEVIRK